MAKNIMLVLRTGGDFKLRDVNLLASRISLPYRREEREEEAPKVFCLTDLVATVTELRDVTLLPMPFTWPGWWAKMNLFHPDLEEYRPFLFMDLDSAVVGDVAKLFPPPEHEGKLIALDDFYYRNRIGSALLWLPKESSAVRKIWNAWKENPNPMMRKYRGDQDFIHSQRAVEITWQTFYASLLSSFKPRRGQRLSALPASVVIVCFHGHPRLWEAAEEVPWVDQYIRIGIYRQERKTDLLSEHRIDAKIAPRPWFSILCPTRGRPDMAARFVESFYSCSAWPDLLEILLYVDEDDPLLPEYVKKTATMQSRIIVGPSEGVGRAWNELAKASAGQYLMMGNDDLFCETWGWDRTLVQRFVKYPDGIFLAFTADGINPGGDRCCFPIVSRYWYETLGEFVVQKYKFFYHDTDLHDIAKKLNMPDRVLYYPDIMFRHNHATTTRPSDATHERNRKKNENKLDSEQFKKLDAERGRKAFLLLRALRGAEHSNGKFFNDLVAGKRVALIGPSPHLLKSKIGKRIDEYDVVCRVNEIFPYGLERDYGDRTDIIFHCCNDVSYSRFQEGLAEARRRKKKLPALFMCAQRRNDPVVVFSEEKFYRLLHSRAPEMEIGGINLHQWAFYAHWIGTHPNTGILALCMLAASKPSELFLAGFSFYNQGGKPEQRHHPAYRKYGGDEKYNNRSISPVGGHLQAPQKEWFVKQFLPVYREIMTLDSYLMQMFDLEGVASINLNNRERGKN